MLFKNLKDGSHFKLLGGDEVFIKIPTIYEDLNLENFNAYYLSKTTYSHISQDTYVIPLDVSFVEKITVFRELKPLEKFYISNEINRVGPSVLYMKLADFNLTKNNAEELNNVVNAVSLSDGKIFYVIDRQNVVRESEYQR